MIEVGIAFLVFFVLLAVSVPVAFSILTATVVGLLLIGDFPLQIVAQTAFSPSTDFMLLAIPFFILTGDLLAGGKLGQRAIGLATRVIGRFRGGLGHASIATSLAFSGVSGSAVADASGLGNVLIPWTKREGYPAPFAAAVNSSTSIIGVILPPSIPLILYASVSGASVAALFIAGIVPGILLALAYVVVCWWVAWRKDYPRKKVKLSWSGVLKDIVVITPAILLPIILIRVVLFGGIATVTEVAVLAALYAVLVRLVIYRDLTLRMLTKSLVNTAAATGVVMLLIMVSSSLSWLLTVEEVPPKLATFFLDNVSSAVLILLIMNVIMLVVGAFLDMSPAILLLTPVLLPLAAGIGLDPVHLGIIVVLNLAIGLFTPPVGTTLYISTSIAGIKIERTVVALVPFYLAALAVLALVTYVPALIITP
ncbi:TRAP transporter large permease [Actinoalloteichus sp. AHMU CJ021]|uniref:TRAP transporter, DctM subunit n=1 Tax=Actinoalloteichus caeruleus DSM 43889 TaxID=1120930 RepID=A0ABT1JDM1_ACTCY|nr:TRAP transporter large permease [Actinoalloteichus caeruleus]AUS80936.1 TRAP transporter large permease [Actinoalloteichus sp. AHMU CJ021]MCP2330379.1 TRAP transporter, DctM subunit [Actinoalloteichus caeruleus DSM 43889]